MEIATSADLQYLSILFVHLQLARGIVKQLGQLPGRVLGVCRVAAPDEFTWASLD